MPILSDRDEGYHGGDQRSEGVDSARGAGADRGHCTDAVMATILQRMVLCRILELQAAEKTMVDERRWITRLWDRHRERLQVLRDKLQDTYATALLISAQEERVMLGDDFDGLAEMLYNRLHGYQSAMLSRWTGD
ncbi:hypothetical protein BBJ28_00003473 [Nothophytophthora sp. Chile5]|nr:hypothetical protein BBJ28_00003473 [Nothophytophthora sp. Chile5]